MVELSLRHKPPDSRADIPAKVVPIRVDSRLPEAKGQLADRGTVGTTEGDGRATEIRHIGMVQAWRELFRTSISRISDHGVRIFESIPNRTIYAALALLAFLSVYALRHQPGSLKIQSQIPSPAMQHERPLVPAISRRKIPNHPQTVIPKKAKSRRVQSDYIAKDTYIYYGKDGKPSH